MERGHHRNGARNLSVARELTTVSNQLLTLAARVLSEVSSCGICGRQSDTGAGFHKVFLFPLSILIAQNATILSSVIRDWDSGSFQPDTKRLSRFHHRNLEKSINERMSFFHFM
jgi:hypothetical protein